MRSFWVVCDEYRRGPFKTEAQATDALHAIEESDDAILGLVGLDGLLENED